MCKICDAVEVNSDPTRLEVDKFLKEISDEIRLGVPHSHFKDTLDILLGTQMDPHESNGFGD